MIPYTYEVTESNDRGATLLYKSPGYPDMLIGVHAPRDGESPDAIAAMYAPIAIWLERDIVRVPMSVGFTGSFTPQPPAPPTPEQIEALRRAAYEAEADPLFFKSQRGEATEADWLAKVQEIKARFPE